MFFGISDPLPLAATILARKEPTNSVYVAYPSHSLCSWLHALNSCGVRVFAMQEEEALANSWVHCFALQFELFSLPKTD